LVASIEHCIEDTIGKENLTNIVSTLVFWLMYDFQNQTKKVDEIVKGLETKWPEGYIKVFKERAINSVPSEFYRNYNVDSILVY
jgi:hypothetical protein